MDESSQSSNASKELRIATDLALRATKATAQGHGQPGGAGVPPLAKPNRDKGPYKIAFLNSTALPRNYWALPWMFLLRDLRQHRSQCRACFTSCRNAPFRQLVQVATRLHPKSESGLQQRPLSARQNPFTKRQGPRPRVVLECTPRHRGREDCQFPPRLDYPKGSVAFALHSPT